MTAPSESRALAPQNVMDLAGHPTQVTLSRGAGAPPLIAIIESAGRRDDSGFINPLVT